MMIKKTFPVLLVVLMMVSTTSMHAKMDRKTLETVAKVVFYGCAGCLWYGELLHELDGSKENVKKNVYVSKNAKKIFYAIMMTFSLNQFGKHVERIFD